MPYISALYVFFNSFSYKETLVFQFPWIIQHLYLTWFEWNNDKGNSQINEIFNVIE